MKAIGKCLLVLTIAWLAARAGVAQAQTMDLGAAGAPSITGSVGGSVTGSSSSTANLTVTVDFGEVSPANPNAYIKVVVPIYIRSTVDYQITVNETGNIGSGAAKLQKADIGFGLQNLRAPGGTWTTGGGANGASNCGGTASSITSPYNNDPVTSVSTLDASGRVTYPSTVNTIGGGSAVILKGPRLSHGTAVPRTASNGYAFDAILVIVPQFFQATTQNSISLTFAIAAGPVLGCPGN